MKLTQQQVDVLRKLSNGNAIMLLRGGRYVFCDDGGRVGVKMLKPLFDADLLVFEYSKQTVSLLREGRRAARHGLSYEGPAEAPLNVQEYAKLKCRVRRQMRAEGYKHLRSAMWSDDPDEREVIEWWRKDAVSWPVTCAELLILDFRPTPPCGRCDVFTFVMQHDGETGKITTKVEA